MLRTVLARLIECWAVVRCCGPSTTPPCGPMNRLERFQKRLYPSGEPPDTAGRVVLVQVEDRQAFPLQVLLQIRGIKRVRVAIPQHVDDAPLHVELRGELGDVPEAILQILLAQSSGHAPLGWSLH